MSPEEFQDPIGGEYGVVSLRVNWAWLSVVTFAVAISSRWILGLFPWTAGYRFWPPLLVPAVPFLCTLGLLAGLKGMKQAEYRGTARLGAFLNGVTLACSLLVFAAFFYARYYW